MTSIDLRRALGSVEIVDLTGEPEDR
jgi:hypothetical protein